MNKKHIYTIDLVLIVGTLLASLIITSYATPLVIYPVDDLKTNENLILFSFEKGETILIDDNLGFTSPEKIYAENNLVINLKPGVYYWKIEGILDSEIRKLTIESEIDLRIIDENDSYSIINAGNIPLNVSVYDKFDKLNETFILDVNEKKSAENEKYIGREK